jgi:hypothetical protein
VFFTVDPASMSDDNIKGLNCQKDFVCDKYGNCKKKGTCGKVLEQWKEAAISPLVQYKPAWRCKVDQDGNRGVFCDENREDLRDGKEFFAKTDKKAVFPSIYAVTSQAFRYKVKFRSREGKNIGFTPDICQGSSNEIPYCYDPKQIEELRNRVDCLTYLWKHHYEAIKKTRQDQTMPGSKPLDELNEFLCSNFAYVEACHPGMNGTVPHDGFEKLYAELMVMMGDDSYTKAFASRFDLAGTNAVSFKGTLFEPGGIDLSGAAGYEMYLLYQAVEYYQEALDRFYRLSPKIWEATHYEQPRNFVKPETVTWYFERIVRASAQKSRAYSEIAKRYQNFNRPDLARKVIERAYTATYLEAALLAQIARRIIKKLYPQDRPQVVYELTQLQRRFHMALLDMRDEYQKITDDISYFGFPPDYIPFPVTYGNEQNAFELLQQRAWQRINQAKYSEDQAINRSRAFDTEKAQFQSQLVQLKNTYENQLADLCGTFKGDDGKVYPAIPAYADMSPKTRYFQDPCGMVGNGKIFQAMGQFEQRKLDLQEIKQSMNNVLAQIEIEKERVKAQCKLIDQEAKFVYSQGEKKLSLNDAVREERFIETSIDRTLSVVSTTSQLEKCTVGTATDCPTAAASLSMFTAATIALNVEAQLAEGAISLLEHQIEKLDLETAKWQTEHQCDVAEVDSNATTANLVLQLYTLRLQALKAQHAISLAMAEVKSMFDQAARLEEQQAEAQQLAINVEAARNDPNTRIYKDDSIVNADIQFKDALRAVYQATKVFEYYAGQSYADEEKLFLIRTVQYGDYNLENYMIDLENTYYAFEENFGMPSTRVAVLSLRDDIMRIPRVDKDGKPIPQGERIDMLRQRLRDPALLDENGYLRVPFSTTFKDLSPLTRVHKIQGIEAEIIGSNVGDTLGRVYLRQNGTAVVYTLDGDKLYYRFPDRLAVINTFFNGTRVFDPKVYRNQQLKDRPYIDTSYELIFNQRDEKVNQDIDLQAVTDIRLIVYYNDFTVY